MGSSGDGSLASNDGTGKGEVFHKGVAISMWQNSGDDDSNWTNFIKSNFPFKALPFGFKRFSGKHSVLQTCPDTWNRYEEDVELAAKAGCNAFRLSIEWARIEPRKGEIDMDAVARYHAILDSMEAAGIEPNATLHHFTHPQWFEDLGGFEKAENIQHFVAWSLKAIELFGSRITFWATFNEPTCAMFLGWITGMHPPGKILACITAGKVVMHKLQAHCEAYEAIKRTAIGKSLQVGLVHHHITFLATGPRLLRGLAAYAADWMNYWWGYELIHQWMLTGKFTWKVPLLGQWLEWQHPGGKPPCDWFGVNYYSRSVVTWYMKPWCLPGEVMTDMYYPIYADGLYEALMQSNQYGIPIYITETGIADKSDKNRATMIDKYMRAMLRAIADGADVRGFYYWTLVDNFEWNAGYLMEFGLYAWQPDGSVDRKLKEGAKALVRFFKALPSNLSALRAAAARLVKEGELPDHEQMHAEAEEVLHDLTARGHKGRRRHGHAMVAAT
uniref:Glycoside hydrolase family 1 protein n=1 Tax=Tetradesmus obliquus TaxID=3088 RepID=A0A383W4H1_TETOB|eukprot:jgi/Sobl393_1/1129/SZX72083.1